MKICSENRLITPVSIPFNLAPRVSNPDQASPVVQLIEIVVNN